MHEQKHIFLQITRQAPSACRQTGEPQKNTWRTEKYPRAHGEDVLNAFAYSSAFHPMCMAIVEAIQQIPIAVQVGMASLAMRRSW